MARANRNGPAGAGFTSRAHATRVSLTHPRVQPAPEGDAHDPRVRLTHSSHSERSTPTPSTSCSGLILWPAGRFELLW